MNQKKEKYRKVIFYENSYQHFFSRQSQKIKAKIVWTIELIEDLPWIPETYLKYVTNTDGLYEIRIQHSSDIFRIFCFFDQYKLIILLNGFQKKSQKTPRQEIALALKLKLQYEKEKREIDGP